MNNLSQDEQHSLPLLRLLMSSPRCPHIPVGVRQRGLAMLVLAKGGMSPGGRSPSLSSHDLSHPLGGMQPVGCPSIAGGAWQELAVLHRALALSQVDNATLLVIRLFSIRH